MKEQSYLEVANEVIAEERAIIAEVIEEEIQPIIEYREKLEREAFEKIYREVKRLEEEVRYGAG